MTVTLDVLPAAHGDALVITYGPAGGEHRILVDGGPAPTYADGPAHPPRRAGRRGPPLRAGHRHPHRRRPHRRLADPLPGPRPRRWRSTTSGSTAGRRSRRPTVPPRPPRRLRRRRPGRAAGRVPHPPALDAGLEHDRRRPGRDPRPRPPHRSAGWRAADRAVAHSGRAGRVAQGLDGDGDQGRVRARRRRGASRHASSSAAATTHRTSPPPGGAGRAGRAGTGGLEAGQ